LAAIDIHRIWWLKHLSSTEPSSSYTFLFGWFVSCTPASLDIVVALARDDSSLSGCQSSLKRKIGKLLLEAITGSRWYMIFTKFVVEIFTVFLNRITYIGMGDQCCIAMSMYKHKWIDELHQKQPLSELDAVILAMNSATASKMVFERHARCLGVAIIGCVYGFVVHDILYFPSVYSYLSEFWITIVDMHYIKSLFDTAWINIQICCGQILFWPILLQVNDLSRVEYAEKAALHKHSMWSSLAVDVLLNQTAYGFWNFANDATKELLCIVEGRLAMLGILFGMTVPAAFIRDMIVLVTLHVSTLHWVMSLLYSQQITSISSFMALVQWNLLRQRLDSYEYTLKQHIVGSLIFTPLLLLLPTSVFYIFFTMMNSSISLVCMLIEVVISIMHATPYINIELWLVRRRRFPPGIWFEIVSCHGSSDNPPEIVSLDTISSPSKNSLHLENISGRSHVLVAILHSNFLTV
ncbi:hypothetical protein CUMW_198170, partial [Citrus unshiu]